MLSRYVLLLSIVGGVGAWVSSARAQTSPVSLTYDALVRRLGPENPFMKPMDLEAAAEKESAFQEAAYPNPEISGSWGSQRGGDPSIRTSQWSVQQEVDYSFRWLSRRSEAKSRSAAAEARARTRRWEVTRRAISLFYNLQSLCVERTVVEAKRRAASSLLARVEQDRSVGAAKTSEWRRAQTLSRLAEVEWLDVTRRMDSDAHRLAVLLGYPSDHRVLPSENLIFRPEGTDLPSSLAAVLERNPSLLERRAEVDVARAHRNLANKASFPTLKAEGFEERAGDQRETRAGLSLTLPLWDRHGAERTGAGKRLEQAEAELHNLESLLRVETEETVQDIATAQQKVKALQPGLSKSDELLRNAELQFKEGRMILSAFLDSLAAAYELKHGYLRSLLDYELGRLALAELSGNLDHLQTKGAKK